MAETATSPTLPSLRELELEVLLREREQQLVDLTTELKALKVQTAEPAKDDSQSEQAVSKAAMAILLPHLVNERNAALGTGPINTVTHSGLVAALRQRTSMLQEENDELYSVLRRAETGRLDEEVKGLRRLIGKLERSLKESNETVKFLTEELERTTEVLARRPPSRVEEQRPTPPRASKHRHESPHESVTSMSSNKPNHATPTGPRVHKKPRTHLSPEPHNRSENHNDRNKNGSRGHSSDARERGPPPPSARNAPMEVDVKRERDRPRTERDRPSREQDRDRERDRDRRLDRDSPRAREEGATAPPDSNGLQIRGYARSRGQEGRGSPRRGGGGGGFGGPNGRPNGLPNRPDRGLAERMGL